MPGRRRALAKKLNRNYLPIPTTYNEVTIDGEYDPTTGWITCPFFSMHIRDLYVIATK